jgi:hypothetical protein
MPTGVINRAEPTPLSKLRCQELTERFSTAAHCAPLDGLVGTGQASTLQIIFPFEARSDLLHHFATTGIVS